MRITLTLAFAALIAGISAAAANAAVYTFDLTGSRTAHFTLESTAPDFFSPLQTQFQNVAGSYGGSPGVASAISFGAVFYISAVDISGSPLGFSQFSGPALFTGPTSSPVFNQGTFQLSGIVSGSSMLTIAAAPVSGVPEPAAWSLMIAGFGMTGYAIRRRLRPALG